MVNRDWELVQLEQAWHNNKKLYVDEFKMREGYDKSTVENGNKVRVDWWGEFLQWSIRRKHKSLQIGMMAYQDVR